MPSGAFSHGFAFIFNASVSSTKVSSLKLRVCVLFISSLVPGTEADSQ